MDQPSSNACKTHRNPKLGRWVLRLLLAIVTALVPLLFITATSKASPGTTDCPPPTQGSQPTAGCPTAAITPLPVPQDQKPQSNISFEVSAVNCVPWELCSQRPLLRITATENLPGYRVLNITVDMGETQSQYDGNDAYIRVPQTPVEGLWIRYWAISEFDETMSQQEVVKVRYLPDLASEDGFYRFDLIDPAQHGMSPPGTDVWWIFPSIVDPLPKVMEQPFSEEYLATTNRYVYLAGHLLSNSLAFAKECPNNGLFPNGSASECGEKAAAPQVLAWQNKYDHAIYNTSAFYNIPPRILKGIIAQESQFWPKSENPYERGLGMFTENGADMVLMWNNNFFLRICQPIYGSVKCSVGYASLTADKQQVLRRQCVNLVGTDREIELLAATLAASSEQVGQLVVNNVGRDPADVAGYIDMWKIATGNYYAGAGCTSRALRNISEANAVLTWDEMVSRMDENCKPASVYVEKVFGSSQ